MKQQKKKSDTHWLLGKINWFDSNSGKGSIIGDDGVWYRIQEFSQILNKEVSKIRSKDRVEFRLAIDSIHPIVKSIRVIQVNKKKEAPIQDIRNPERESSI